MGYGLNNYGNKDVAKSQYSQELLQKNLQKAYGQSAMLEYGIKFGQYTIGTILNGLSKSSDGDDDGKGGDGKNAEKIKTLESQVSSLLTQIGANDKNDINEAVSRAQSARDDKINAQINASNVAIQALAATYDTQIEQERDPDTKASLIQEKESAVKKAQEEEQKKLEELKATEDAELKKITDSANEAILKLNEIAKLKGEDTTSVPEATEKLNEFNKQIEILRNPKSTMEERKAAANRIYDIKSENPNDATIRAAWPAISKDVTELLSGTYNEDNYKGKYYDAKAFGL